jgi:hypothetical protein
MRVPPCSYRDIASIPHVRIVISHQSTVFVSMLAISSACAGRPRGVGYFKGILFHTRVCVFVCTGVTSSSPAQRVNEVDLLSIYRQSLISLPMRTQLRPKILLEPLFRQRRAGNLRDVGVDASHIDAQ